MYSASLRQGQKSVSQMHEDDLHRIPKASQPELLRKLCHQRNWNAERYEKPSDAVGIPVEFVTMVSFEPQLSEMGSAGSPTYDQIEEKAPSIVGASNDAAQQRVDIRLAAQGVIDLGKRAYHFDVVRRLIRLPRHGWSPAVLHEALRQHVQPLPSVHAIHEEHVVIGDGNVISIRNVRLQSPP